MRSIARIGLPVLALIVAVGASTTDAEAANRSLRLFNVHTKEKAEITFKRNGRYDSGGLRKISHLLRDWRSNEPTKIDPQLLDIVWEAYRQAGSREYIHIISGYRSPKTNAMLRRTRGGQAKKSQHMLGKAMDFYIPGVKLSKLREIGFKLQGGGVGYYPRSGSPFVHFDTGNVRAWPRMSRSELARVFPKGNTLHLPASGSPLPGYNTAMAAYKQRKAKGIAYAGDSGSSGGGGGNFFASLFGGGNDEADDAAESAVASAVPTRRAPAAPVAKPEPSPAQLLAALPASAVPLPVVSPRRTGAPVPPAAIAPAAVPIDVYEALLVENRELGAQVDALETETMALQREMLTLDLQLVALGGTESGETWAGEGAERTASVAAAAPVELGNTTLVPPPLPVSGNVADASVRLPPDSPTEPRRDSLEASEPFLPQTLASSDAFDPSSDADRALLPVDSDYASGDPLSVGQDTEPLADGEPIERLSVAEVEENSAAEAAGFLAGDVLLGIDGLPVEVLDDVLVHDVGDPSPLHDVEVLREGERRRITLAASPAELVLGTRWVDPSLLIE